MKFTYNEKKNSDTIGNTIIMPVCFEDKKDTLFYINESGYKTLKIGYKPAKDITARSFPLLVRKMVKQVKEHKIKKIAIQLSELQLGHLGYSLEEVAEIFSLNCMLADYEYVQLKTKPEEGWDFIEEIIILGKVDSKVKQAITRGRIIAEEVNKTRTLANTPGGSMTPRLLALAAQKAVKQVATVKVKVLNKKDIEKLKMGALLGVAKGSSEDPRFIIMEYLGATKKDEKPIVLVGKGVTFDTGGLNLKPTSAILGMNMDMSGGAAVIHTITLAARLKVKKNIVALVPAVENMISGSSFRPGDVLRSMSGKTIEVLNTDAEGRLILADALTYAKRFKPSVVIDVATLTGAAVVALGQECSAIFTKDDTLAHLLEESGEKTGDLVWRMPLWDEYEQYVKGNVGDVTNLNATGSPYGGSINAAIFLYQFAKDLKCKWAHVDMAPRMESTDAELLAKGAVGAPVRMLLKYLES